MDKDKLKEIGIGVVVLGGMAFVLFASGPVRLGNPEQIRAERAAQNALIQSIDDAKSLEDLKRVMKGLAVEKSKPMREIR